MADYIDDDCAFVVDSIGVPGTWPHDTRQAYRTLRQQVVFASLVRAYRSSRYVATEEPETYRAMSRAAIASSRRYCSSAVVRRELEGFLSAVVHRHQRSDQALTI